MTTQEAIDVLVAKRTSLEMGIANATVEINSINVAINQLQGLLDTPSADMVVATNTIKERDATIVTLEATIVTKDAEIAAKNDEIATLKSPKIVV